VAGPVVASPRMYANASHNPAAEQMTVTGSYRLLI
jgi:hypothetical protein